MNEVEAVHEAAKGTELINCASNIESALMGIMPILIEDETHDAEVQELIEGLRTQAHRLRRIANTLAKGGKR